MRTFIALLIVMALLMLFGFAQAIANPQPQYAAAKPATTTVTAHLRRDVITPGKQWYCLEYVANESELLPTRTAGKQQCFRDYEECDEERMLFTKYNPFYLVFGCSKVKQAWVITFRDKDTKAASFHAFKDYDVCKFYRKHADGERWEQSELSRCAKVK
jgi:hypothetical protein